MEEPEPPPDAPEYILYTITGPLQIMDSCLRLYGHSQLLSVAEQINGPDFAPFGEAMFIKQPGLGASVAWHQDGTTHWDKPDLDEGTHGFNFMFQFHVSILRKFWRQRRMGTPRIAQGKQAQYQRYDSGKRWFRPSPRGSPASL